MGEALEEDLEIRALKPGTVLNVQIDSLRINERLFYFERRKINPPATGESEHEHLILLQQPKRRTFAYTLDARNLKVKEDCIVQKHSFEETDFGRTHYIEEYTSDREALELANRAFE